MKISLYSKIQWMSIIFVILTAHVLGESQSQDGANEPASNMADEGTCEAGSNGAEGSCAAVDTESEGDVEGDVKSEEDVADTSTSKRRSSLNKIKPRIKAHKGRIDVRFDMVNFCHFHGLFKSQAELDEMNLELNGTEGGAPGFRDGHPCCETLSTYRKIIGMRLDSDDNWWEIPSITVGGVEKFQHALEGTCVGRISPLCNGVCREQLSSVYLFAQREGSPEGKFDFHPFPILGYCGCTLYLD